MAKTGPRLKVIRRLGTPLPGLSRKDSERRPYPPGEHGRSRRRRRKSDYRRRLEEKQKLRYQYGVTERQLLKYFEEASKHTGVTGEMLLAFLERRLDNVVFRLGFAPTIPSARQLVVHGHIRVDGRRVDRPGFRVSKGNTISVKQRSREMPVVMESVESGPQVRIPSYLAIDEGDPHLGRVLQDPARADIPFIVDEKAVVEFYAR
jgi:small subunit ribosomal protein S4